ncbi:phospholipid carrier-dependent glycosyltransferase [Candidatus Frankia meridionalis]|uniref:dolichyl-phosphate-mannose--protein mannosyltransferase n=1 Tax=Candidatus Protofrankia californiensis TaxID=1839754 RepID=UPI0010419828
MAVTATYPTVDSGKPRATAVTESDGGGPTLRDRLVPPMPTDRIAGWLASLAIAAVAGVLRFWQLTEPRGIYFDEVYYTHDAYGLLTHGYELTDIKSGCNGAGFVVHPPLGKWLMAASEWIFGYTDCADVRHGNPELGWRFASAVAGTLAVLVLARIARRMFRSTLLGCFAGLLLAFDGLEFVQSRIGILDIFLMTGLVLALACLVLDRDHGRARLASRLADTGDAPEGRTRGARFGARLGARPWRLACGLCLGAAMGVKWSAVYTLVGFAALAIAWDAGARRTAGVRRPVLAAVRRDGPQWFASFGALPIIVFFATWTGWFVTDGGYNRHRFGNGTWAALHGWWDYQQQIFRFHEHLDASHPYASKPLSWLVLARPVAYFYSTPKAGEAGCTTQAGCSREILAIGNPAIWWVGTLALVGVLALWVSRRDWRAALVLVGFATSFLPWLAFPSRTMFLFYALPLLPFLVLGLTALAGVAMGSRTASDVRRLVGSLTVGIYAIIVVLLFVYFYPIMTAQVIPTSAWQVRMWFPGWI